MVEVYPILWFLGHPIRPRANPRKNVEWDTRSQHVALTVDGIRPD